MSVLYVKGPHGDHLPATLETVTWVADGDTYDMVEIGLGGTADRVRVGALQTLELQVYGQTVAGLGTEAALYMRKVLAANPLVVAYSRHAGSMSGDRDKRFLLAYVVGRWQDVTLHMIETGRGMLLAQDAEYDWNYAGALAQRKAMVETRDQPHSIWNPARAGVGPAASVALSVNWDQSLPGGEWVELLCAQDGPAVDLTGWSLCDAMTRPGSRTKANGRGYEFPPGLVLRPGERLRVYVREGYGESWHLSWRLGGPILDNPSPWPVCKSDTVWLMDPLGNIRTALAYPDVLPGPVPPGPPPVSVVAA